jgi:hypothetical protein
MEKVFFKFISFLCYAPVYILSLVFYGFIIGILFVWDKLIKRKK